jgi:hypothetical protein
LLRMISRGLKDLLTVTATEIFHQAAPSTLEVFSRETPLGLTRRQRKSMGCWDRKTTRLCGVALSTRLLDLLGWIGDRLSLGPSVYVTIYNAFGNLCCAVHKLPSFNKALRRGLQTRTSCTCGFSRS